ncbi:MAG: hypothetical protein BGO29_11700 [Bacteroidales bacterium 36-12]|nr:MAG: hypothetical protein BGO29_11700 [Bacteroidales bacterium 36-12]
MLLKNNYSFMLRKLIFLTSMLSLTLFVSAGLTNFDEANKLYSEKKYEDAAEKYESILKDEGVAPEIYYNLGNTYFKMNELGKAILNYERALRIAPAYEDAKFNLEFANQKVTDRIETSEVFFLKKWVRITMKALTTNNWFYLSAFIFIFALISALLFVFGRNKSVRKISFYISFVLIIVSVTFGVFSGMRKNQMIEHQEAIVMDGVVIIKGSPDKSGTDLFQLHEGTKVSILSTLGDWFEIKLINGSVGWVEMKKIEKI